MGKVELKEIGLDIGLAFSKHFYKTDYLHYGFWPEDLNVKMHYLCSWSNIIKIIKEKNLHTKDNIDNLNSFLSEPEVWRKKYG